MRESDDGYVLIVPVTNAHDSWYRKPHNISSKALFLNIIFAPQKGFFLFVGDICVVREKYDIGERW